MQTGSDNPINSDHAGLSQKGSRRLRIGVILPGFPAQTDAWFLPQISEMQLEIHAYADVRVFALSYPEANESYHWNKLPVRSFGGFKSMTWLPAILSTLTKEHRRQPFDLLHAYWATEPGLVGVLAKRKLRIPLLISSVGGELVGLPHVPYGAQLKWRWRRLVPYVLRNADYVICGCTAQARFARELVFLPDKQYVLLPFGVNVQIHPNGNTDSGTLRLLAVSSLIPVKNIEMLLKALSVLPVNVRLDIVGDGPLRSQLERQVYQLNLVDRVVFHGWVPHGALSEFHARADIFVHASWHEEECCALQEALAAGLPVVSSKVGIARDLVVEGKNGYLFEPDDSTQLVEALRALINQPERLHQFGVSSRRIAEQELNRSRQIKTLLELYAKAIGNRNGHSIQS